jgi:hypothetical protein
MLRNKIIKLFWALKIRFCGWFYCKILLTIIIFITNSHASVHHSKNKATFVYGSLVENIQNGCKLMFISVEHWANVFLAETHKKSMYRGSTRKNLQILTEKCFSLKYL